MCEGVVCVRELCVREVGGEEEQTGVRNQKQEPHTKM